MATWPPGRKAITSVRRAEDSWAERQRYAQTLVFVDRVLRGWGGSFAYTTSVATMDDLDVAIDKKLDTFRNWFTRRMEGAAIGRPGAAWAAWGSWGMSSAGRSTKSPSASTREGGSARPRRRSRSPRTGRSARARGSTRGNVARAGGPSWCTMERTRSAAALDHATTNNRMELTAVIASDAPHRARRLRHHPDRQPVHRRRPQQGRGGEAERRSLEGVRGRGQTGAG